MSKRDPALEPEDDGGTIVDMNVDGMPWYHPGQNGSVHNVKPSPYQQQMTKEELRAYKWAAVKAGLLVVLIFAVVFGLFIAFCDFVWFR